MSRLIIIFHPKAKIQTRVNAQLQEILENPRKEKGLKLLTNPI